GGPIEWRRVEPPSSSCYAPLGPRGARGRLSPPDPGGLVSSVKTEILHAVDGLAGELETLSRKIHDYPELGYQEVQAAGWLSAFLEATGLQVERGVSGVPTAFRATVSGPGAGPTVAILCEYDALPGIGHACGHNIIAASGAGAGAALAAVRARLPAGRVQVIGTPAEEGGGGEGKLLPAGGVAGGGCAGKIPAFGPPSLNHALPASVPADFQYTGRAAHAASDPWAGVNALDACIQTFNAVSMLRQQMRSDCRIHGIIVNGGTAANIIPEYAKATFYVRAPRIDTMWELHRRVVACAEGAARATGATLTVTQQEMVYEPL